eukprot:TRINITY_DN31995_c0_g1_i1.p1 TRINITY_DN31995_c0_g1~~TRINITY_DN31995_c0_g1_i1.p1  ORF type:complete len:651 (+),score=85.72 TRINITY_DN31995_c0_g1_i1:37-1989(+)
MRSGVSAVCLLFIFSLPVIVFLVTEMFPSAPPPPPHIKEVVPEPAIPQIAPFEAPTRPRPQPAILPEPDPAEDDPEPSPPNPPPKEPIEAPPLPREPPPPPPKEIPPPVEAPRASSTPPPPQEPLPSPHKTEKCDVPLPNSQHWQDWFAYKNYFKDLKQGTYLDVGANHYETISNTYYFDRCLGWKGLCVEPNPNLAVDLRKHRGCAVFNGCVSTKPTNLTLCIPNGVVVAAFICKAPKPQERSVVVPCDSVSGLVHKHAIKHVDWMSLDVEGYEPNAIASFLPNFEADVITVEISTGRIQRALTQYPLLTHGFTSVVPLVGDGIFVRRQAALLRSELTFPKNQYFTRWWLRLCTEFEKLSRHLCHRIGLNYVSKAPVTHTSISLAEDDSDVFPAVPPRNLPGDECREYVLKGNATSSFTSSYSQDWFVLSNYFGYRTKGFYVDIGSGHWKSDSNTWFLDKCLGWSGVCVIFDPKKEQEWKKERGCQVVVGCKSSHCEELKCGAGGSCPQLHCGDTSEPQHCQRLNLSDILAGSRKDASTQLFVSVDIAFGPYLVALSPDSSLESAAVYVVNGVPTVNYKLMHWPLSLRGFGLAATFHGSDVFVKQQGALLRTELLWPAANSKVVQWMREQYVGYGLETSTIDTLLSNTF